MWAMLSLKVWSAPSPSTGSRNAKRAAAGALRGRCPEGRPGDADPLGPVAAGTDDPANLVLARGKWAYVLMNLYPYSNGHLMVAPYRHCDRLADLSPDELLDVMRWVQQGEVLLREELRPDGFNIGLNLGKVAG